MKTINIKGKEYTPVVERIKYLADQYKGRYEIETSYEYYPERKMWVVKATLALDTEEGFRRYTGLSQEIESTTTTHVNYSSALENAETSAVGRACAMAGIGVIDSIASVDEINKAKNRSEKKSDKKDLEKDLDIVFKKEFSLPKTLDNMEEKPLILLSYTFDTFLKELEKKYAHTIDEESKKLIEIKFNELTTDLHQNVNK